MGSDKSKKKTTLDWVLLVVIVVAVAIGGYFLYQKVIKYMIWPEKPPGPFTVHMIGGKPVAIPTVQPVPSVPPSASSFEDFLGGGGGAESLLL